MDNSLQFVRKAYRAKTQYKLVFRKVYMNDIEHSKPTTKVVDMGRALYKCINRAYLTQVNNLTSIGGSIYHTRSGCLVPT